MNSTLYLMSFQIKSMFNNIIHSILLYVLVSYFVLKNLHLINLDHIKLNFVIATKVRILRQRMAEVQKAVKYRVSTYIHVHFTCT